MDGPEGGLVVTATSDGVIERPAQLVQIADGAQANTFAEIDPGHF